MLSFTSYFKKAPAFWITIFTVLLFESVLHLIPNLHYLDGKGAFFTYYKRFIAEKGAENFDIIMFGDSRSLSITGNPKEETHPYSFYNFSLPAAGPWYFKFFLKKYVENHSKPKLVIWAADPQQFAINKTKAFHDDPALWNEFKHRLLNLFTIYETLEQYEGKELFFILKEYIPHSILSVRHRQGFESILTSRANTLFKTPTLVKENKMVEEVVSKTYGKVNLGTFFYVPNLREAAEKERDNQLAVLNKNTDFNLDPLQKFLDYCAKENVIVVVLNIPRLTEFQKSNYFQKINPEIAKLTSSYPNAVYMEFSEMEYDLDHFSEAIHYNDKGDARMNQAFQEEIFPKLNAIIEGRQ